MTRYLFQVLSVLLVLFGLPSCQHLSNFPLEGDFEGVKTALDRESTVSVLIVHGMGEFSEGDPDTLINTMTGALRLRKDGRPCIREIANTSCDGRKIYGHLIRQNYHGVATTGKCYRLRIYVLHWDDATACEKNALQRADDDSSAARYRLPFISRLKRRVVNNGVVDAGLYLAHFAPEIQYPFAQSIRWIRDDSRSEQCHEVVVVGFSLGNTIIIDTLDAMRGLSGEDRAEPPDDATREAAETFIEQMTAFFMHSNSYPLFETASHQPPIVSYQLDQKTSCDNPSVYTPPGETRGCKSHGEWDWRTSTLGRFMQLKRSTSPCFQIVSFNDPNDLFSYTPEGYYVSAGCKDLNIFLNQNVRNVKWAIFGIIDPAKAHVHYGKNASVLGMMIYGVNQNTCCD